MNKGVSKQSGAVHQRLTRSLAQANWKDALKAGHQVIPNILIHEHARLNLDPLDVLIILNLNMRSWKAEELPYPKPASIAKRISVTQRTIERRLQKLQGAKLVKRLSSEPGASKKRSCLDVFWLSVKRRIENWRKRDDSALRAGIFKA